MKVTIKSYLRHYWSAWLILSTLAVLLRFFLLVPASEGSRFVLFMSYALMVWIPVMLLNWYEGGRLLSYLDEHHHSKWEEITYVSFLFFKGPGGVNSVRALRFVYSGDDLGDPVVSHLKANYRGFTRFMLIVFLAFPIIFISLM